jgi:phage tail tape-measure protein
MQQHESIERKIVTDDVVEGHETVETDHIKGAKAHGDEEAGGAILGGATGALVGAAVGGPVGAVVGGAIGAASGATAGAVDSKSKDEVVVTHEVTR